MLWTLAIVWLVLIAVVVLIYILLFGQSKYHRDGYVGKAFVYLNQDLGRDVRKILEKFVGRKGSEFCSGFAAYCIESRNPFLQIFYMAMFLGGCYIFYSFMFHRVPLHHQICSFITVGVVLGFFYKASTADPGVVHEKNLSEYAANYPYDGTLYYPKNCRTCLIKRPARSKHCPICKHCCARYDHHCPWVNNCVGARNLRWFLGFLASTAFICFYAAYGCLYVLWYDVVVRYQLLELRQGPAPLPWTLLVQYAVFQAGPQVIALGLFLSMAGGAVLVFLLYHLNLVRTNVTSVESLKWSYAKEIYAEQQPKREEMLKLLAEGKPIQPVTPVRVGMTDASKLGPEVNGKRERIAKGVDGSKEEVKVDVVESAEQMPLLREPINVYNRGAWANFAEALFPISMREDKRTLPTDAVMDRIKAREEQFKLFESGSQTNSEEPSD